MLEDDVIHALESAADRRVASLRRREIQPLRGLRGVSDGDVARIIDATVRGGVDIDADYGALDRLFGAAFEDGLVAIGVLAAVVPDAPDAAWELAHGWLERVDDTQTADALGWMVLGPALLAQGLDVAELGPHEEEHAMAARTGTAAALAFLPEPLVGPCAAGLRARLGERHLRFVEAPLSEALGAVCSARYRDDAPAVRKAVRRLLRTWTNFAPADVVAWYETVSGGLPRMLGDEVVRARRKAARA